MSAQLDQDDADSRMFLEFGAAYRLSKELRQVDSCTSLGRQAGSIFSSIPA